MIDTHLHLWGDRSDGFPILIRARISQLDCIFSLADVAPTMDAAGVTAAILVAAAQDAAETHRLLALARQNPRRIAGVVGWLDLAAVDACARIAAMRAEPGWLGLRLPLAVMDAAAFAANPNVRRALAHLEAAGALVQLLIRPDQIDVARDLIEPHPRLRAILDHAANPACAATPDAAWLAGTAALAAHPRLVCKVSAFWQPGDPPPTDETALPFLAHLLDRFGPARCMAASNWPVSSLLQPYGETFARLRRLACRLGLSPADEDALFRGTAQRLISGG